MNDAPFRENQSHSDKLPKATDKRQTWGMNPDTFRSEPTWTPGHPIAALGGGAHRLGLDMGVRVWPREQRPPEAGRHSVTQPGRGVISPAPA